MSSEAASHPDSPARPKHFIEEAIEADVQAGRFGRPGDSSVVRTRFPSPTATCTSGTPRASPQLRLAERYGGACKLRFDDTNPEKEEEEYVDSIVETYGWLGFRWEGCDPTGDPLAGVRFASDYFQQMHDWARSS